MWVCGRMVALVLLFVGWLVGGLVDCARVKVSVTVSVRVRVRAVQ